MANPATQMDFLIICKFKFPHSSKYSTLWVSLTFQKRQNMAAVFLFPLQKPFLFTLFFFDFDFFIKMT